MIEERFDQIYKQVKETILPLMTSGLSEAGYIDMVKTHDRLLVDTTLKLLELEKRNEDNSRTESE